ncbi:radical SAM protein [uncultured Oxalicibacterium sp.]|uniref:radical SAM protein n=1 Tax=uncultured Oxalicibacterium sp. TaxID=1168540 RepID=UPI0025EA6335|nr:radical SAM protein [uncultured Oxalicibacterium sp.]
MGRFDHTQYVSMTMEFRCNLKCVHCMIEDTMDHLKPQTAEDLHALFAHNVMHRKWKGLILTGSEITLHRDLPEWVRAARLSGFDRVRIQTHGMRLGSESYCRELVDAGVNEFFVSIAGADAATHDEITTVPGSFEKSMRGLAILDGIPDVLTITNTVVTERSYRQLPQLVATLAHLKQLAQMEFWFYFPMSEQDDKQLLASHLDALPFLKQAIADAWRSGRGIEVKNFPECLLGKDRIALYNDQPELYIDEAFWTEFMRNGFYQCVHRDACASKQCLGLNTAYIKRFGWHERELSPLSPEQVLFPLRD